MTVGLLSKTIQDEDWHLEFCDFKDFSGGVFGPGAWGIPPRRPEGRQEGEGITVVQLDTGCTDHPEIKCDRYLRNRAKNFFKISDEQRFHWHEGSPDDTSLEAHFSAGHGTKTASILMSGKGAPNQSEFPNYQAAKTIWGVAPKVKVIPYRVNDSPVLSDEGGLAVAMGIFHAVRFEPVALQVGVISISLGRWGWNFDIESLPKMREALSEARKKGIVVCAAAGQAIEPVELAGRRWGEFSDVGHKIAYPAREREAISVAGCKHDFSPMDNGFLGAAVDITAPAQDVWAAEAKKHDSGINFGIVQSSGTSYATAIVSGACALWQAHHGRAWLLDKYGPEQILPLFKYVLKKSAHKPDGWDSSKRGVGVLDAYELLRIELPQNREDIPELTKGRD